MDTPQNLTKYDHPYVTVDIVLLTIREGQLQVALVKRGIEPFKDVRALPGGFFCLKSIDC